jgi:branched-chain amino acid transport system substrate-binding protein
LISEFTEYGEPTCLTSEQTGTKNADELVSAIEQSSFTGTTGTLKFYGRDERFPHDPIYGKDAMYPVFFQWQKGDNGGGVQKVIWPNTYETTKYQQPAWI